MKRRKLLVMITILVVMILVATGALLYGIFRFSDPTVGVTKLRIVGVDEDLRGFTIELGLKITNPNNAKIHVDPIKGDILLDGKDTGDIIADQERFDVGARDSENIVLTIHVDDLITSLIGARELSAKGSVHVDYLLWDDTEHFEETVDIYERLLDLIDDLPGPLKTQHIIP